MHHCIIINQKKSEKNAYAQNPKDAALSCSHPAALASLPLPTVLLINKFYGFDYN